MSQFHAEYGDWQARPSPRRRDRLDENGFDFDPSHSSPSFYDDPDEAEAMRDLDGASDGSDAGPSLEQDRGLFAATPLSSPTPTSSLHTFSTPSAHRRGSSGVDSIDFSQRDPASAPFARFPPPPPPPKLEMPRSRSGTIATPSTALSPVALFSAAGFNLPTRSSGIVRPNPVRPMPMPTFVKSSTNVPSSATSRSRAAVDGSEAFQPTETHTSARSLFDTRSGPVGNRMQFCPDAKLSRRRAQAFEEVGDYQDEIQTWQEQETSRASGRTQVEQTGPPRAQSFQVPRRSEPQVQYYEDLEPESVAIRRTIGSVQDPARASRRIQPKEVKLVPVSALPEAFRSIWRFGVFNAVQSFCFNSVYMTDENVVVSAPTGAGKTVLFELAVIRVLSAAESTQSKVLYIAPTKSLCAERAEDWRRKFGSRLGWKVVELTGDSDIGSTVWREISDSRIIVTTPEKWDALTRRWHDHDRILSELQLFCVDEVHSVGTDVRGAVLEVVVSRMKTLGTSTRFVAVSATVPNIKDVAQWLKNGSDGQAAHVFEFGDDFRPCPLQKIVCSYNKHTNDFAFAKNLNNELFKLVKKYSMGHPVLIFCSTRKGCLEAAEQLVKDFKDSLAPTSTTRQPLAWPKPPRASYSVNDKALAALIENGVSIHHAGMDVNDRKLVEKLFVGGKISVICSTSTLAVGVNLPARMVIIRGTKGYIDGRSADYADMDILQMLGRAGRPQFDKIGVALIMTDKESQQHYENLVNAQRNLESCLHKNLTEHINSEITLRTITDVESALRWLRSTFLHVRISKNPTFYAMAKGSQLSPDARLEEICVEAVRKLVSEGIVEENEDSSLAPNDYGQIMSRFYISVPTFVALKSMESGASMRVLLKALASAEEFSSFRFRQGEKSVLAKVNKSIRFPVEKLATTGDRIMILLQAVLGGITGQEIKTETVNPMLEIGAIWPHAIRIAKAMFDLAVLREDGAARLALELLRSLHGRCWDGSSFVLRQLKGVGEKGYKALVDADIRSFADVAAATPDRLEFLLHRKPPYGTDLVNAARSFPKFEIDLSIEHEEVHNKGVEVEFRVGVSLEQTKPPATTRKGRMNLYASLLILTSDNHFIEFRRCPLAEIAKGSIKPFSVSVILVKPSQRIVVSVSCDMFAGSEVRAEVKPATKASSFPVPALSSDPEEGADELRAPAPTLSRRASEATPAPRPSVHKHLLDDEDDPTEASEPHVRKDGKYECNHACGDKSKCKHLCCREGLDRPPRPSSKKRKLSASAVSASTSNDQPRAASGSSKPQSRIPMRGSAGVTLAQDASGKVITRRKRDCDDPAAPASLTRRSSGRADSVGDADEDLNLPTPDDLVSGKYDQKRQTSLIQKRRKKGASVTAPKKKVVHTDISPVSTPPRSRTVSPDPFVRSLGDPAVFSDSTVRSTSIPAIVEKKPSMSARIGKSNLVLHRAAKMSLDEFDSSDDEGPEGGRGECAEVGAKKLDSQGGSSRGTHGEQGKVDQTLRGTVRSRDTRDDEENDPFDTLFPDEGDEVPGEAIAARHQVKAANEDEFDSLDSETAVAIEQSFEDLLRVERETDRRQARADDSLMHNAVEHSSSMPDYRAEGMLPTARMEGSGAPGSSEKMEIYEDNEEDEFDAWLAENVVIKD